jgi:hypothetical protein
MEKEATETKRIPVLFLRINGDTRSYALLPEKSFDVLWEKVQERCARGGFDHDCSGYAERMMIDEVVDTFTRGKGRGFVIESEYLKRATNREAAEKLWVTAGEGNLPSAYYLLDFEAFADIVRDLSIMAFE